MNWFQEEKKKSPVETLIGSFTEQSEKMHALAGFPGILLLLTIILLLIPTFANSFEKNALGENAHYALAGISLIGAIVSYLMNSFHNVRRMEAEAKIINDFTSTFVESYLKGKSSVDAETVTFAITHIIGPLFDKKWVEDPKTPSART